MGKSKHDDGGGVNYVCLPLDPEFPSNAQSGFQSGSYMYGVEYEKGRSSRFFANQDDHNAPCAVCEVQGRSAVLMIPAKRTCPAGWTKEYDGLLASQDHYEYEGSTFVCVSHGMESRPGGNVNEDAGVMYVVEARCGSLPCPPYRNGYELSCVVCTK